MAKAKVPLSSFQATGRLTRSLTFASRRKRHIVEKYPVPKDAKSLAQLSWRHMYQKAVALWNALSLPEKQDWESLARPRHMTGFAYFISQALKPNPGLYLPLQGGHMTGHVTADPGVTFDGVDLSELPFGDYLPLAGGTMAGNINMDVHKIIHLPAPTQPDDPARKAELDLKPDRSQGRVEIAPWAYTQIIAGTWDFSALEGQWADHFWRNTSNANADRLTYNVYLEVGTYSYHILTWLGPNNAILRATLDTIVVTDYDCYNASVVNNIILPVGTISIPTRGVYTLTIRANSKNPASGGYFVNLSWISFVRLT